MSDNERPEMVVGITPCGVPSAAVCSAVSRAGGLGVLDLGAGDRDVREALAAAVAGAGPSIGIRVPQGCALTVADVADVLGDNDNRVDVIVLGAGSPWHVADVPDRYFVLAEVTSVEQAARAAESGADGVLARGNESGGQVSEYGSFVLLQRLLAETRLPVWVCGGVGPRTAAAAVVGGAAGVVLDTQLALLQESEIDDAIAAAVSASDGADTAMVDGRRVLARRGAPGDVLEIGQDAHLASVFAQRYGTVTRAVRAVHSAIADALRSDAGPVLATGSPFTTALGIELPVVQGPMTRVSDQAAFAAEVAGAGGLPFLALALSSGDKTRQMLTETAAALGDSPWGVGVLGFAQEEVRAAQLEVIRELRPPVALIAGGRPDQARELEDVGIATFLHVPSPGLLAQFLEAGARRFVFEGAECGGHVGPRSSFSLWEAATDVLREHVGQHGGHDLQVVFAGGIHDARSAAMVATLAEPLARKGVGVGLLMGTAYLFTEEAVSAGAVLPTFQRQVLAAQHTETLQTAPGHVTRVVPSPFTTEFDAIRDRLRVEGHTDRDLWERLEALNTGRLRIASKGIRREGVDLVAVDEQAQLADGLFMAGQVATLRSGVTTVAALHGEVTADAADFLASHVNRLREELGVRPTEVRGAPSSVDIAVVGMACVYPGAPDLASFWANVLANADQVTEVPHTRWDPDTYFDPDDRTNDGTHTYSKWGGFIPPVPFDPLSYGIPPSALASIEPVQLLALEVARRALTDAGYGEGGFDRERASVVFGAESGSDLGAASIVRMLLPSYVDKIPEELDEQLPRLTEDFFPGRLVNIIAGRIANRLDLGGANYSVDAACASSLAAVDLACKELVHGGSDLVLAGGADLHNGIEDFLLFTSVGALSPSGRCRTFDSDADGIALGEGVGCVVLKRLSDAERDGDRVYAVIKGIGSGSDGKALGLTAPRPEGQRRALDRAYANAGVSPANVGLLEAHGTGTVVGDRTELEGLTDLFSGAGATPGSCVIGSVKSQIGHTKCAAGIAGLIKSALAVHTGVLPPTLHVSEPNPAWRSEASPFTFRSAPAPWLMPAAERHAGISAFGFGGTNFHVVLSGHATAESTRHGLRQWPAELFTVRGADDAAASRQVERLAGLAATNDAHGRPWSLADLARTCAAEGRGDVRLAFVARDLDHLGELLAAARAGDAAEGLYRAGGERGKLAVLFPGQGSQRPGMLRDLFVAFPELHRFGPPELLDVMQPAAAFDEETVAAQENRLRDTRVAQPALGVTGLAARHLLDKLGVRADMFGGHSYGELVALSAAGAIDGRTLLDLSTARATAILDAAGEDPGAMAAVAASAGEITEVLESAGLAEDVVVANHNGPRQVVVSGPTAALEAAVEALRSAGHGAKRLPVACAFHSSVVRAAGDMFGKTLAEHRIGVPDRPVWTNREAAVYPSSADGVRAELAAQIGSPVLFAEQIEAMYADGARVFFEAGPGQVLSRLVGQILGDRPHTVVGLESRAGLGIAGLLHAVAQLAVTGVEVRTGWLFSGRGSRNVGAEAPPKRPQWTVDGHLVRTIDGEPLPGGLAPARKITQKIGSMEMTTPADRDALVSEFLRTSREMVAAQRDVLLSYFGSAPAAPVPAAPQVAQVAAAQQAVVEPTPEPVAPQQEETTDVLGTVVSVIARRTGYPAEMITPDLDLEADLSIDSIKRTEIAGELTTTLGRSGDTRVDDLVKARTAAALAEALATPSGDSPPIDTPPLTNPEKGFSGLNPAVEPGIERARSREVPVEGVVPGRYVLEPVDLPAELDATALVGTNVIVAGGPPELAEEVAGSLSACGAMPIVVPGRPELEEVPGEVHGLISLHAMESGAENTSGPVLPSAFAMFRSMLARSPRWVVAVAPDRPVPESLGLRGFFRSLHREYPDTMCRLIEVDAGADGEAIATEVAAEVRTPDSVPVVIRTAGRRRAFELVPSDLGRLAATGAGPAGTGAAELDATGLDGDSVVLLIGGARGITSRVAATLARERGCRIELAGRTALTGEAEHPTVAAATDLPALRTALAGLGEAPAGIDGAAREILARREVEATLRELRSHGSEVGYRTVDSSDRGAMRQLVKEVHTDHGRIDAVVFAAGAVADKLVADKDPESFARVYGTKVDGAGALLDELADLPGAQRFVVLFGSVAGALGNRGQTDYAAANDALESLGSMWRERAGHRVLTVHWGPWAPRADHGGMVDDSLARAYVDRGIEMIDPDAGVACLLRELAWGEHDRTSVVYTGAGW
ncbi:polyketide-type polyunsaturated fatty acid synthase PfaA [Herbihabitans rhizosphaerae]|uniref:Polyketide-type polyunsaturated fatty acid synthase PfaA n=1 Tax=Herbihabitans rhizosphaerae TaxID=1872711 RepID=A0A4Q7KGV4_9PSEU|nr:type I polyketide synthase [Herbihabitans rhizosphaerae]RZS34101.1 polyketide-type polyunsaturated fatty acid synthase PfaA [Herbihabitans rhizosphaerae]